MGVLNRTNGIRRFRQVAVVDDDFVFRTCFEILLKSEDFAADILSFEQARAALDYLRTTDPSSEAYPDLLFLDINMPEINGWQFLDEFARLPAANRTELPIFVLSSSIDPRDLQRSREYESVLGYIAKPLTRENLIHVSGYFVEEDRRET